MKKFINTLIITTFFTQICIPFDVRPAFAQGVIAPTISMGNVLNLPAVGSMVPLSGDFQPMLLKGIRLDPKQPLKFDFILDAGENSPVSAKDLEDESAKLIKYFLASLTVPEDDLWVNLSPYERERIVPGSFGQTEMGRDMLAQDYLLKQLTASLMYPENDLGREFWDRIYQKAYERFGTTDVLVNTFNKIWIVPDFAEVYTEGDMALIVNCHLKVLTEQDYLARAAQENESLDRLGLESDKLTEQGKANMSLATEVIRDLLIPEIEKEVNTGKNFAQLRQIYHSLILATWFKQNLKDSLVSKVYVGKNKVSGVDVADRNIKEKIYRQYLEALKQGVYNYVREDYDVNSQRVLPRKYFSGGTGFDKTGATTTFTNDPRRKSAAIKNIDHAMLAKVNLTTAKARDDISGEDGPKSPERRNFLTFVVHAAGAVTAGAATLFVPSFFPGAQALEPEAIDPFMEINFTDDYLRNLSGKSGEIYFQQIDKFLSEGRLSRQGIGRFLRRIYTQSPMVWMRAKSIGILVRHGYFSLEEIRALLDETYDAEILTEIGMALAENPTPQAADLLTQRMKAERGLPWIEEPFYQMLKNAPRSVLTQEILAQVSKDDYRAMAILAQKISSMNARLVKAKATGGAYLDALAQAGTPEARVKLLRQLQISDAGRALRARNEISVMIPEQRDVYLDRLLRVGLAADLDFVNKNLTLMEAGINQTYVIRAYAQIAKEDGAVASKFIEFAQANKNAAPEMQKAILEAAPIVNTPQAHDLILQWSKDPQILKSNRTVLLEALALTGTVQAEQQIMSFAQDRVLDPYGDEMIALLGKLRTPGALQYLKLMFKSSDQAQRKFRILQEAVNFNSIAAFEWVMENFPRNKIFITELVDPINLGVRLKQEAGTKAFNFLIPYLKRPNGREYAAFKTITRRVVTEIDKDLYEFNNDSAISNTRKEQLFELQAQRLQKNPEALYLILALSAETTSHNFPTFMKSLHAHLSTQYGQHDYLRFSKDVLNNAFLPEFFFTLMVFNRFDSALVDLQKIYGDEGLLKELFAAVQFEGKLEDPVLTAKFIEATLTYARKNKKEIVADDILKSLVQSNESFKYLLKIMQDEGRLDISDPVFKEEIASVSLPELSPVWQGPQKEWVDNNGVVRVGMHWSTAVREELWHYEQFPEIFRNGKDVDSYYKNFTGYKDLSSRAEYQLKLKEYGAQKVLVKTFAETGRKIEIYLYPDYRALPRQMFPITVSRGHAGEKGNDDYPGQLNAFRLVSHCRSIGDAHKLIAANPFNVPVTISGTGRAMETNADVYYSLEYLGAEQNWGSWQDVKNYISPHIARGIQKYNYPDDDASYRFAATLEVLKREQKAERLASLGDQAMITRRDFLKISAAAALGMYSPKLLAFTPQFLKAAPPDNSFDLKQGEVDFSYKYFKTLSKRNGIEYFNAIKQALEEINKKLEDKELSSKALKAKKLLRIKIGKFLWQVFVSSPVSWMRAQAIELLVKQDFLTLQEIRKLFEDVYDKNVLEGIVQGLADNPTAQKMEILVKRVNEEQFPYWIQTPFYEALENVDPQQITPWLLNQIPKDDVRALGLLASKVKSANSRLVNMSLTSQSYIYALGQAATPEAEDKLIRLWRDRKKNGIDEKSLAVALGLTKREKAEKLLQKTAGILGLENYQKLAVAMGLIANGSEKNIEKGFKLWKKLPSNYQDSGLATPYFDTENEFLTGLIEELAWAYRENPRLAQSFSSLLRKINSPQSQEVLAKLVDYYLEEDRYLEDLESSFTMQHLFIELAKTGSQVAENKFFSLISQNRLDETSLFLVQAMGFLKTPRAYDFLVSNFKATKDKELKAVYLEAFLKNDSLAAYEILSNLLYSEEIYDLGDDEFAGEGLGGESMMWNVEDAFIKIAGFYAFDFALRRLKTAGVDLRPKFRGLIRSLVADQANDILLAVNNNEELSQAQKDNVFRIMAERLKNRPKILYLIIALSQEVTSHSYAAFSSVLDSYLSGYDQYGAPDFLRFAEEHMGNEFLADYLFSLIVFDEFDNTLTRLRSLYTFKDIVNKIFDGVNINSILDRPVLVGKLVEATFKYVGKQDEETKSRIVEEMLDTDVIFQYLGKLMLEDGALSGIDPSVQERLEKVAMPVLPASWKGPQKEWINQDGEIEVGMYWNTSTEGEAHHYNQFSQIFHDGKSVPDVGKFYKNLEGYKDVSNQPRYQKRMSEVGAEKMLMKSFKVKNAKTGKIEERKVVMYLYSSYSLLDQSPFYITISRGHAGSGNDHYSGVANGVRLASHCRSINDADTLLRANPLSSLITITGTGYAVQSNPAIYYLLEYLATQQEWGSWDDVKEFIRPHMPASISKYNFSSDDVSFRFAAIVYLLHLVKKREAELKNSVNPAMALGQAALGLALAPDQTAQKAEDEQVGGIDFNPDNLTIRRSGRSIDMDIPNVDIQELQDPSFPGFTPVILEIIPINNLPLLLGEAPNSVQRPLS